jgi:hypothetical protein
MFYQMNGLFEFHMNAWFEKIVNKSSHIPPLNLII